ncbi:glycosyltransferase [candidate division KSB1 bacterium]|nr:glycosyltransferase [candidate division KSB1 bacterium]
MTVSKQKFPELSVIIPSRNRCDVLEKTLLALEEQQCAADLFQVIIIDDNSSDNTFNLVNDFIRRGNINLQYFKAEGKSAGNARNLGLTQSIGDIILFLDADTIPDKDVISKHLQFHRHFNRPVCVLGDVKMASELANKSQARLWDTKLYSGRHKTLKLNWWQYRTANSSLKWSVVNSAGGFNNDLVAAEDTELAYRLYKLGLEFYYINEIVVTHYHPMDLNEFVEKGVLYGKAVGYWYHKEPELRRQLAQRYGVYAPELPVLKRMKYFLRTLVVNRYTVPYIMTYASLIRRFWFPASDVLYKCVFRFHTRLAFRTFKKRQKMNKISFEV